MKKILILICGVAAIASAAVYQDGSARNEKRPGIKIMLRQINNDWLVQEGAGILSVPFATVRHVEHMLNKAETRELARAVAVAVANHLGSTNDVRIIHFECPTPASSNIIDVVNAWLMADAVVDEIVPLH